MGNWTGSQKDSGFESQLQINKLESGPAEGEVMHCQGALEQAPTCQTCLVFLTTLSLSGVTGEG